MLSVDISGSHDYSPTVAQHFSCAPPLGASPICPVLTTIADFLSALLQSGAALHQCCAICEGEIAI